MTAAAPELKSSGAYPSVKACADALFTTKAVMEPDAAIAACYEAQYQKFKKIYPALKDVFPALR